MAYRRRADADERIRSAVTAAEAIVRLNLHPAHKRELLSVCIWKITEATPMAKYETRFQSKESRRIPYGEREHDHVYQRKRLIKEMIENPNDVRRILQKAVACAVTRAEHERLTQISQENPELDGWERYKKAQIEYDDLEAPQTELP